MKHRKKRYRRLTRLRLFFTYLNDFVFHVPTRKDDLRKQMYGNAVNEAWILSGKVSTRAYRRRSL